VYADIDVGALGWTDGECHDFLVRGRDAVGNWGPLATVRECAERGFVDSVPPAAPVLSGAQLTGVQQRDVGLTWLPAPDEGQSGGTTRYRVYRQTGLGGSYAQVAEIPAGMNASYSWTDVGAGDGDANVYLYRIRSADAAGNEAPSLAVAGKFTRALSNGWQLVSVPVTQADPSIPTQVSA